MEKENEKVLASGPKGNETAAGENSNYGTELQKGGGRDELEEREEVEKPPPSPFFYSSKQTPPLSPFLFEVLSFLGEISIFGYMGYLLLTFPHQVFKALFLYWGSCVLSLCCMMERLHSLLWSPSSDLTDGGVSSAEAFSPVRSLRVEMLQCSVCSHGETPPSGSIPEGTGRVEVDRRPSIVLSSSPESRHDHGVRPTWGQRSRRRSRTSRFPLGRSSCPGVTGGQREMLPAPSQFYFALNCVRNKNHWKRSTRPHPAVGNIKVRMEGADSWHSPIGSMPQHGATLLCCILNRNISEDAGSVRPLWKKWESCTKYEVGAVAMRDTSTQVVRNHPHLHHPCCCWSSFTVWAQQPTRCSAVRWDSNPRFRLAICQSPSPGSPSRWIDGGSGVRREGTDCCCYRVCQISQYSDFYQEEIDSGRGPRTSEACAPVSIKKDPEARP
ncbi:unnamed protein product [Pleuronectes platessa]|uniref:Uncharacterized protein n=1 Tax=Pleuronectes platessa TaxID=8262 RepID=A0A9N7TUZ3_PLEPL|nr:unnamed protein product [Pleuronectes platessa]